MRGADPEFAECLPSDPEAAALISELNNHLNELYRPEDNHFALEDHQVSGTSGTFLVARVGDEPAGCGAVRMADKATGEIKRMWVRPKFRGRGLGAAILGRLEDEARSLGARKLVLEMGNNQPAAAALYLSAGFRPAPCWGEYLATPASVCLEKVLEAGEGHRTGSIR